MGDLSPHFSRSELQCSCCGRLQIDWQLLDGLEKLRELAGVPMQVHAGYRCPEHNKHVGWAPRSEHMLGMGCRYFAARDFVAAGL